MINVRLATGNAQHVWGLLLIASNATTKATLWVLLPYVPAPKVSFKSTLNVFVSLDNLDNSNLACHENCATCMDVTNFNCPVCDTKAYLFGTGLCLGSCPYGYKEDQVYHLCHFDTKKLTQPKLMLDYLNFNCTSRQYTVPESGVCSSCDSSC